MTILHDIQKTQFGDLRILYLKEVLEQFDKREVAIYGAGTHTEWLLSELEPLFNKFAYIIDQNPDDVGNFKFGLRVISLQEALDNGIKAIVISSSFEKIIYDRIKHVLENGIQIFRLYSGEIEEQGRSLKVNQIQRVVESQNIYRFVDRRKKSNKMLIILAGYKKYLWPFTLNRVAQICPEDIDVCLASSGVYVEELEELALKNNWSYLSTSINEVSVIQNIAISKHPEAQWIYKIDEDIFLTDHYFENMWRGYERIEEEGLFRPGIVSPLLNINGYTHVEFLKIMGLDTAYKERFGELRHAANQIKCHYDGKAAQWIWEKSLPLDQVAATISENPFSYSVIPHRFSIGAILLQREFWETIGGFKVGGREGVLGIDEEDLCYKCIEYSRVMCAIHNIFCGHFSFFPQEAAMKEFLFQNEGLFMRE